MSKKKKTYTRLKGKKRGFVGSYSLWLGEDHLLAIDSKQLAEDYKRFYYEDIQAIITRKTSRGKIYNILFAGFVAISALLAFSDVTSYEFSAFFRTMACICFLALLFNVFRGPTSICHLRTAVQTEKLPSLNRLSTARKAISRLMPLIRKSQGDLAADALYQESPGETAQETSQSGMGTDSRVKKHEHGTFHNLTFLFLLSNGIITSIEFFNNNIAIDILTAITGLGAAVCVIIALVKQHESDIKTGLRTITWSTFAYICISFFISFILQIVIIMKNPELANNQWKIAREMSSVTPWDSPWLMGVYIFSICSSFVLAVSGLIMLKRHQLKKKQLTAKTDILNTTEPVISLDVPPLRSI